jgi:hypothetical protein
MDYTNQNIHQLLNRHIAADLLSFVLDGQMPVLPGSRSRLALSAFFKVLPQNFESRLDARVNGIVVPGIVKAPGKHERILYPTHSLRGSEQAIRRELAAQTGMEIHTVPEFDLLHRPLAVWREIL